MELPTLDESLARMKAVSGVDDLDPDMPLLQSDVDSLDLMEWLIEMKESYTFVSTDESMFENIDDTVTFRRIYDQIIDAERVAAVASAPGDG